MHVHSYLAQCFGENMFMWWFISFEMKQLSFKGKFLAQVMFGRQQRLMPTAYKPAII